MYEDLDIYKKNILDIVVTSHVIYKSLYGLSQYEKGLCAGIFHCCDDLLYYARI